jgi:23S rRNA (pseudouridine1915-N3)-methyltransferase
MKIKIISFAKKEDPRVRELEIEYLKRIKRFADVQIVNLKKESEFEELHLAQGTHVVALMDKGKEFSTPEMSQFLKREIQSGRHMLCFILGGASGLPESIVKGSHFQLSLSRLTLPHRLARLFLIEALYRSFDMLHGGNYDK